MPLLTDRSVRLPMMASVTFLVLFFSPFFTPATHRISAQGGRTAAALLGTQGVAEAAMGGVLIPGIDDPDQIHGNPGSLTYLSSTSVALSWENHSVFRSTLRGAWGTPLGELGAIGAGILFDGVSPIDYRNRNEQSIGTGRSGLIVLSAGGSVGIGPGSIGGALRYLSYGASGVDAGSSGVTVDLGGTLRFRQRLSFGLLINNVAGILNATYRDGLHEQLPSDVRIGASWQHPFVVLRDSSRRDPTGRRRDRELPPQRYAMVGIEVRAAPFDDSPVIAGGIEVVPFIFETDQALGLRTGLNSRGEFGLGIIIDLPVDLGRRTTLGVTSRFGSLPDENGLHLGLRVDP